MVSIIIPVYNTDIKLLERCFYSIDIQQGTEFEAVVIDDGSEQDTAEYLTEYSRNKKWMHVFHQKNQGVSAARNLGINKSCGNYLLFVDGDDELCPNALSIMMALMNEKKLDIVIGGLKIVTGHSTVTHTIDSEMVKIYEAEEIHSLQRYILTLQAEDETPELLTTRFAGPWGKLIHRQCIADLQFPIGIPIGEDIIFNEYIFANADRIGITPAICYKYYHYNSSAINRYRPNGIIEHKKFIGLLDELTLQMPWLKNAIAFKNIREMKKIFVNTIFHEKSSGQNRWNSMRSVFEWPQIIHSLKHIDLSVYIYMTKKEKIIFKLFIKRCFIILYTYYQTKRLMKKGRKNE